MERVTLDAMSLQDRRARSAILLVVPELAPLIDHHRRAWTADGAGVPPHVTLATPFLAPAEITPDVRRRIAAVAASVHPFRFTVTGVGQFPDGPMYLTPEPTGPFLDLIGRLRREFTEVAPYWDRYTEVIPHVTVADPAIGSAALHLGEIASAITAHLPVACAAREAVLLQRVRPAPAPWDVQGRFPLGAVPGGSSGS